MESETIRQRGLSNTPAHWVHELLDKETARQLAIQAQAGDIAARDELILKHQRLILSIAWPKKTRFLSVEDLVSVGNKGLLRAIEKYDPERGLAFSTYAIHWIKQAIRYERCVKNSPIRVPYYLFWEHVKYRNQVESMLSDTGEAPEHEQACDLAGVEPWKRDYLKQVIAVREKARFLSDEWDAAEVPVCNESQAIESEHNAKQVDNLLSFLSKRESHVLRLYFGIGDGIDRSLKEVAEIEGRSYQCMQQIRDKALKKLRYMVGSKLAG